jgi:hypothetical protein
MTAMKLHSKSIALLLTASFVAATTVPVRAGDYQEVSVMTEPALFEDPWADARRPITNPTLFDLAMPQNILHPIFIYNNLPSHLDTVLGRVPVGGDYQVYAVQLEIALTERLSLNATKDGYIDFNPDATLSRTDGFANVGGGLKYAWLLDPANGLASNFQLLYEAPIGNSDVWQGYGDGIVIPSVNVTKLAGPLQFVDQLGVKIPIDSSESTVLYNSVHLSYAVTDWFFPLVELNWFHVLDAGDGSPRFNSQAGGAVPAIATFEGGDLVNLGALNADVNDHFVSLGVGFRARIPGNDRMSIGVAYEFPLTDEEASLMENRITVDMTFRF